MIHPLPPGLDIACVPAAIVMLTGEHPDAVNRLLLRYSPRGWVEEKDGQARECRWQATEAVLRCLEYYEGTGPANVEGWATLSGERYSGRSLLASIHDPYRGDLTGRGHSVVLRNGYAYDNNEFRVPGYTYRFADRPVRWVCKVNRLAR